MTLNDIGRMLKLAKVPRSKVIQTTYPSPSFVVIVPKDRYFIIANVVGQLKLRTDNVTVKPFDGDERDVRAGEHVYVKVTGDNRIAPFDRERETRSTFKQRRMMHNHKVVIDCASVVAL